MEKDEKRRHKNDSRQKMEQNHVESESANN